MRNFMQIRLLPGYFIIIFLLIGNCCSAVIRYVKTGSAGTAPYISWATASNDLQAVINQSGAGDEIWIATGTYRPNRRADALTVITVTDRNNAFVLKSNVKIYAGFTGLETLLSQRNIITNVVTLSGDIGTAGVTTDNCYHVVIVAGLSGTLTLLDGVSIVSGNANASFVIPSITVNTHSINPRNGGGMYKVSSNTDITDCRFRRNDASGSGAGIYETISAVTSVYTNCTVTQNISATDGGGMYILSSSCLYKNCSFNNNDASDDGAGIYLSGSGSPAFTGCTFSSNDATGQGGALYITGTGSPSFDSCTMNTNTAGSDGGAVSNLTTGILTLTSIIISGNTSGSTGGGIYNNNSPAQLTNCLISGNLAIGGGGIWNAFSNALIINCTIAGNRATSQGGGIANGTSNPTVQNSIVYGNTGVSAGTNSFYNSGSTPVVEYSLIQGGYAGTGNVNADPLFVIPVAASFAPTITGDYKVQKCSPVINAGNNPDIPAGITTDLLGDARINYVVVDMGAFEKTLAFAVSGIVYVDNTKNGDGSTWADALPSLADALLAARYNTSITAIWVAKGTYYPTYNATNLASLACNVLNRDNAFVLVNDVKVYGGFVNGDTSLSERDHVNNLTILSGDMNGDNNIVNNSYHVVISSGAVGLATLDGFTITKGNANGGGSVFVNGIDIFDYRGGGVAISSSLPQITNCRLMDNFGNNGGAMSIISSSPIITNCIFSGNTAGTFGGAIDNYKLTATASSPVITNCLFSGNKSLSVGGAFVNSPPNVLNINNCTVTGNYAVSQGGGFWNGGLASETIRNSIVWGNRVGAAVNNIFTGSGTSTVSYSAVEAGYTGTGNINTDPLFINPQLASAAPTVAGDYQLQKCSPVSPAIDAGNNASIPAGITTDLHEQVRIVNVRVDMGAYETHYAFQRNGKVYVDKTKTGKGTSWSDAAPELADALKEAKYNTAIEEIWVAKGTYNPLYNAADGTETFCKIPGRGNAFVLVNNVKIYGGFAGGETDTSGRNFVTNETIMSGDIGILNDTSDNCYHVAISAGVVGSAVLDGFSVSNGNSSISYLPSPLVNTESISYDKGGGIYITESSPVIKNCSVRNNYAYNDGGGMYLYHSTPVVANCMIAGNLANKGGGIALYDLSPASFNNCIITGNKAYIASNILSHWGGGVYIHYTNPTFSNCTIAGNYHVSGNTGDGIFTYGVPVIKNSIIERLYSVPVNSSDVSYSYVSGGHPGLGNISLDPLFVSPFAPTLGNTPNTLGDYHLQACSPAINMGDNSTVISLTDFDKNTRIRYSTVDMGAYEKQDIDLSTSTWKGVNTNWNDKINWCGGFIPYDTTNVVIPSSLSNYPVINTGYNNGVKNILLSSGTSVSLQNNGSLSIYGTYTNNGSTINNKGKWVMAGSSAGQAFPGTLATVSGMNQLEIKNPSGIIFNKSFSITGSLIPTSGSINVNNVEVTLKSSDTSTASVDVIQPAASINYTGTGAFIVERFINTGLAAGQHQKTWQFLATPTTGQTINQSWQESGATPAGYGTIITGTGTGFDATTALPSLKYYNQAAVNWTPVTNTGNALVNSLGYMLFVRGDRTVTTFNGSPNNTVMRSKGELFSPTNPAPPVPVTANKYQTFGNPYASRIAFSSVYAASTGINDVFYVWDPKLAGSYNVGGYQTITGIAGYVPTVGTPPTGNPASDYYPAGVPSPYIESGQAVFVKGNGSGGNVNFNENAKATGSRLVNRPANTNDPIARRQFLFTTLFTNTGHIADGNIVAFEKGFGNVVNEQDAEKIMNGGENFGLMRDGNILAVEAHEPVKVTDTIFYNMSNLRKQTYQLRFAPVNMGIVNHQPFLVDRFTNVKTHLSLTDSSYVDFVVTANAASAAADRFMIVFKGKGKMPYAHTDIKAFRREKDIVVEWKVDNETGISEYILERSRNGEKFSPIINVHAKHDSMVSDGKYFHQDENAVSASSYYRIKYSDIEGVVQYSKVANVLAKDIEKGIRVYPNPVVEQKIHLWFTGMPPGKYTVRMFNTAGQLVYNKHVHHIYGKSMEVLKVFKSVTKGNYLLEIMCLDGEKISQAIIF